MVYLVAGTSDQLLTLVHQDLTHNPEALFKFGSQGDARRFDLTKDGTATYDATGETIEHTLFTLSVIKAVRACGDVPMRAVAAPPQGLGFPRAPHASSALNS